MKAISARTSRALWTIAVVGCLALLASSSARAGKLERDLMPVTEALGRDKLEDAKTKLTQLQATYPQAAEIEVLLGEIHWRLGRLGEAKKYYSKARELAPGSAAAVAGLALVEFSQDNVEAAGKLARQAIDMDKKLWLARYVMGRVFLADGDIERAYEEFAKGKGTKKREDGRDLFEAGMGLLALAEKDPDGAETNLIRARALAQNTVDHVVNLAQMYEDTGQWGPAANVIKAMTDQVGPSPQLSFRLGRAYEQQQRWNDALKEYQTALQADSTHAPSMAALGHLFLLDTRMTARAVQILSRAVELHATPASQFDLGVALTRANRAQEAVPHLLEAQKSLDTPEVKLALMRAYLSCGIDDEGLALLEKDVDVRLEAAPGDFVLAGLAHVRAKRYEDARKSFNKALDDDPENVEAHYQIGYIELLEKNYEAAIPKFQMELQKDPKNARAWLNLGIAQQGTGDMEASVNSYRRATELAPNSAGVWVQLGGALSTLQRVGEAQTAYARALQEDPKNGQALRGRGFTYLLQEKYPQAINDLRVATQISPNDVQSWVWLGQALLNNGDRQLARPAFEKAIQLEPGNESAREGLDIIGGS